MCECEVQKFDVGYVILIDKTGYTINFIIPSDADRVYYTIFATLILNVNDKYIAKHKYSEKFKVLKC
jgi:hypothetical protein